jgi:hypothetical protein
MMWMLNARLEDIASRVRLGAAMLNVMSGEGGESVRDVKEDMVMARGVPSSAVEVVQTTTECGTWRIADRSCSARLVVVGLGRAVVDADREVSWERGGAGLDP